MKSKLLTFSLFVAGLFTQAQDATDFTATDINGNTWHLYDLLDEGKTVILDFSTTWCSPCWQYHHEDVLSNLYEAFGPNGSDQLVVLLIEADPGTGMADLQGNTNSTQGDWITGTNYPIIDNTTIHEDYGVFGFPTIYTICPDRSMSQTNRATFDQYVTTLRTFCSSSIGSTKDVIATPLIGDLEFELGCGNAAPKVDIMNIGTTNITSATVELSINGSLVETKSWSGNIGSEDRASVYFSSVPVSGNDEIKMEITSINGGADDNPGNNKWVYHIEEVESTPINTNQLTFEFRTDPAGYESSFEFSSVTGNVLASDGPFSQDNHLYTYNITLPASGCYQLGVYDSFGDGLYPNGAYYRLKAGNTVLAEGDVFEYLVEYLFNFDIQTSTGIEEAPIEMSMFPNPANELVTIQTEGQGTVTIFNMEGKQLLTESIQGELHTVDVSGLNAGVYFVQISNNNQTIIEKLIKE